MNSNKTHDSTNYGTDRGGDDPLRRFSAREANSPPPPPESRNSTKEPKHWYQEGWKISAFVLNLGTLIAVVWYACVATQQRDAMITANKFTQRVFQANLGDFGVANLSRQSVGWSIRNYGKTTAENVTWNARLTVTNLLVGKIVQSAALSSPPFNIKEGDPPLIHQFPLLDNVGRSFDSESFRIDVSVKYENGFGEVVSQSFCREIIGKDSNPASVDSFVEECFEAEPYRHKRIKELLARKKP